jgi:uncharacterized protein YcbK (DUF882 family)
LTAYGIIASVCGFAYSFGSMTLIINHTRRDFMRFGLVALACSVTAPALAAVPRFKGLRALAFHNLHTDERLHVDYWRDGKYNRAALAKIDHVLRDHYSGDVHPMDVRLMDLLHDLQGKLGNHGPIEIISGYRSPKTNMRLAQASDGVARRSYHTRGMAIDLRLPGTSLSKIHHTALAMQRGGVGYYPDSQFVHVDVGPIRTW